MTVIFLFFVFLLYGDAFSPFSKPPIRKCAVQMAATTSKGAVAGAAALTEKSGKGSKKQSSTKKQSTTAAKGAAALQEKSGKGIKKQSSTKKQSNMDALDRQEMDEMVTEIAKQVAAMMGVLTEDDMSGREPHYNASSSRDNYNKLVDGVVRIYCTHSEPNYGMPWQRLKQDSSTSSGFIIEGNRILTNAHAVEYGSLIQVKKRQSEKKYVASVIAVGHECDLAILSIDDPTFWESTEPLVFGDIPDLLEDVSVVGYPVGGDSISISSGVVSRIEMQEYAQASAQLLAIQIDAAINPGNSGGPVVHGETYEVVGVAFQSLSEEDIENIGYVVPVNVINHFLDAVRIYGRYSGVCEAGLKLQGMDNLELRTHFNMSSEQTGVLIIDTAALAPCAGLLMKGDVLLSIDDIPIANDGTIPFRDAAGIAQEERSTKERSAFKERVQLNYYFSQLFPNDVVKFEVLRHGQSMYIDAPVWIPQRLIPRNILQNNYIDVETNAGTGINGSIVGGVPSYLMVGGLVMVSLSREYLEDELQVQHMGSYEHWSEEFDLLCKVNDYKEELGQEVVLLSQVLAHNCNIGYENLKNMVLKSVNGVKVLNLRHLRKLLSIGVDGREALRTSISGGEGPEGSKGSDGEKSKAKRGKSATTTSEGSSSSNSSSGSSSSSSSSSSESDVHDGTIVFEFLNGRIVVLNKEAAVSAQNQLLKEHFIPSDCSPDLLS